MPRFLFTAIVLLLASFTVAAPVSAMAENKAAKPMAAGSYLLATATAGGTYYPVGVAIATIVKTQADGVALSAVTSAGSAENIALLTRGEVQFAIVQGLYADWALNGQGPFQEAVGKDLRAVTGLWPNIDHWLALKSSVAANDLADLKSTKGLSLSIGKRNSGAEGSGRILLKAAGIAEAGDHFSLVYQGYGQAADALQNGTIDLANMPAGAPVSGVTRAMAARKGRLKLLSISDEVLAALKAERPFFQRYVLPANTYPGQEAEVQTTAQPNLLVVRADVPDEHVYQVVKTLFENLSILKASHKATHTMDVHGANEGLPLPLHPGAARYFKEVQNAKGTHGP